MNNDIQPGQSNTAPQGGATAGNASNTGATQPTASASPFTQSTGSTPTTSGTDNPTVKPKKKSPLKWILLIGIPLIIIIAILVWYFGYFTNKYVVVRNALYSYVSNREDTVTYSASLTVDDNSTNIDGSLSYLVNGQLSGDMNLSVDNSGKLTELGTIAFASDTDNLYLKVKLPNALDTIVNQLGMDLSAIDDQWIELDPSQTANQTSTARADTNTIDVDDLTQCFAVGSEELDNRASQQQLVDALLDTDFLVVGDKITDGEGTGYQISLDGSHYGDFVKKLVDSNWFQAVSNCLGNKGVDIDDTDLDEDTLQKVGESIDKIDPTIKIYVSSWGNNLDKLALSLDISQNGKSGKMDITFDFAHKQPNVEMPSDAKTIEDVIRDNPELLGQFLNSGNLGTSNLNSSSSLTTNRLNNSGYSLDKMVNVD